MEREAYRIISSQDLSRYAKREVEIIPTNTIQFQDSSRYEITKMVSMNTGVRMVPNESLTVTYGKVKWRIW
ncbi:unnamed protein product [Gordionus sp. m RMFG-2023]